MPDTEPIKIDVQGYEQPAFEGMQASLDRFVPALIFEYEDWAWKQSGSSLSEVGVLCETPPKVPVEWSYFDQIVSGYFISTVWCE